MGFSSARAVNVATCRMWVAGLATGVAVLLAASESSAHYYSRVTTHFKDRTHLQETIDQLYASATDIDEMAMSPAGEWVIVAGRNLFFSAGFPSSPLAKIQEFLATGRTIDVVAFTPGGDWVVVAEDFLWRTGGILGGDVLVETLFDWMRTGRRVTDVVFDADGHGWSWVAEDAAYTWYMPEDFHAAVFERRQSRRRIGQMAMGFDGSWAVLADQSFASDRLAEGLHDQLRDLQRRSIRHDRLLIGLEGDFIIYSHGQVAVDPADPMSVIENDLGDQGKNIWTRMEELNVPGISIAVIDDNRVVYHRGYGTLEAGTQRWVRSSSPFAAGSMSKPLSSIGIMSLVDGGRVRLQSELADFYGQVGLWIWLGRSYPFHFGTIDKLPLDIQLWELLSHMANMNNNSIEIHPTYWPGSASTLATLLGYYCNSSGCGYGRGKQSWYDSSIGTGRHGETFAYSNKGYLVAQAIAETVTGSPFEAVLSSRVLEPLGMDDSGFSVTLPPSLEARAAVWHDADGTPIARHVIPNSAAGGLYTTPSDYAELLILLMNDGRSADGVRVLSPTSVDQILTDRTQDDDYSVGYGLGVELQPGGRVFSHGGAVKGGSSCMEGDRDLEEGIVILTNAEFDQQRSKRLMREIREAFREAYDWPAQDGDYLGC